MSCWSCGADVPVGALFCPACGVEVRTQVVAAPDEATTEQDVHALLAEANLMRLRKDLPGASQRCIDVLQRVPKSASAHSLLGDICRDEGRLRDAIEWYRLALSLDPSRLTDRSKLDQLIDQVYTSPSAETDTSSTQPEDLSPRASHLTNGPKAAWYQPQQWRHRSGLAAALVGVGVLCLVTVALYIILARLGTPATQKQKGTPSIQAKAGILTTDPQTPADSNTPEPTNTANTAVPDDHPSTPPDQQKPPSPPSEEENQADRPAPHVNLADLDKREETLQKVATQLAPQLQPPVTVLTLGIDPRKELAEITFSIQRESTVSATRDAILNAAVRLGNALAASDSKINDLTVKAYIVLDGENQARQVPLFIGDTSSRRLLQSDLDPLTREKAERVFSDAAWDKSLIE
jgi:hypothetical protein